MSSLSVGIVGLPNVGKSTLFNALLQKQQALAANYPFATIEPNVGVVPVPDERLPILADIVHTSVQVPATVEFVDIAGLVAGASEGEGLGNKFLAHIRETSVIAHVVRAFSDSSIIKEGSVDPVSDFATIMTELQLADLGTLQKQVTPKSGQPADLHERWARIERWKRVLNEGRCISDTDMDDSDRKLARDLGLITAKAMLVVCNVDEEALARWHDIQKEQAQLLGVPEQSVVVISARLEEQLNDLSPNEKRQYLLDLGVQESGLERLVRQAYDTLKLQSFYTAGEKEVRAWTIAQGTTAPDAAGVIHTDFTKHFIKAHVVSYPDFVACGGWKEARAAGRVRQEGREYLMQPEDVVEFAINA